LQNCRHDVASFEAAQRFAARDSLLGRRDSLMTDQGANHAIRCGAFDLGTSPARSMKLPDGNFRNRQISGRLV
jgi:hypothetical protein